MAASELCRVLIVDDEILIRQGIKHYVNWEQPKLETKELLSVLQKTAGRVPALRSIDAVKETGPSVEQLTEKLLAGYDIDCDQSIAAEVFPYDSYCLLYIKLPSVCISILPYR